MAEDSNQSGENKKATPKKTAPRKPAAKKRTPEEIALDKTGFNHVGFRPANNQIALLLSNDDLLALDSPLADRSKIKKSEIIKPKKSLITDAKGTPKIIQPDKEAEAEEMKKNNRTFTVASMPLALVDNGNMPEVGDEVSLLAGQMVELVVDDLVYGVVPAHRILAIHKVKIN